MNLFKFLSLWSRFQLLLFIHLSISYPAQSQSAQHIADSLELVLSQHPKKDTTRIDILAWLSIANGSIDPIKAIGDIKEAIAVAKTLKSNRDYGLWVMLGWAYMKIDDYPRSIEAFQEIFKIVPPESIEYATALHFIGMNYKAQGDLDKALSYTKAGHALELKVKAQTGMIDPNSAVGTPWNLGEIYFKKNDPDSALIYGQLAYIELNALDKVWQKEFRTGITTLLGKIYIRKGQKDSAKWYLDEARQSAGSWDNESRIIDVSLSRAKWFIQFGSLDSAMRYAKDAYVQAKKLSHFDLMFQSAGVMRQVAERMQHYEFALKYNDLAMAVKDSMLGVDKIKKTQAMHYDFLLKEQQVESVRTELQLNNKVKLLGLVSVFIGLSGVFLYLNNRRRKKIINQLNEQNKMIEDQKKELSGYLTELKDKQTQLIHAEKMASLGELTAGIAHEIQNPLNFVNNFSEISVELIEELEAAGNSQLKADLLSDIKKNLEKINHHGKRAENIVRSMLEHSQAKPGQKTDTNINALAEEYLKLSYHAIRAKEPRDSANNSFNVNIITELDPAIPPLQVIPADIGRVLINIFNNSFYSMTEKKKKLGVSYFPSLSVQSFIHDKSADIIIKDNGSGIPPAVLSKIFQPFFTTKPTGSGTGLGLSLSYDIITKTHGGSIAVESKEGEYCTFIISLPLS